MLVSVVEEYVFWLGFDEFEFTAERQDLVVHLAHVPFEEHPVHEVADQRVAGKPIRQCLKQFVHLGFVEIHEHALDDDERFDVRVAFA